MVNVVICGTPGTGKSTLIEKLRTLTSEDNIKFINLSKLALESGCTYEYDEELDTHVMDEDRLNQILKAKLDDPHSVNVFECIHPDTVEPKFVDLVFIVRTNNTELYDRLKARGYNEAKISNNVQAEIFQTILDEANETYTDESILIELQNDSHDDLDKNVELVRFKLLEFCKKIAEE